MYWSPIFEFKRCLDWPSLSAGQAIPEHLYSKLALGKRPSVVGLGIINAACLILKEEVRFGRNEESLSASFTSSARGVRSARRLAGRTGMGACGRGIRASTAYRCWLSPRRCC